MNRENDEQRELLNHLLEISDGLNSSSYQRPGRTIQQEEELRLSEDPMQRQMEMATFLKNISIMGAALIITYFGSGELCIH